MVVHMCFGKRSVHGEASREWELRMRWAKGSWTSSDTAILWLKVSVDQILEWISFNSKKNKSGSKTKAEEDKNSKAWISACPSGKTVRNKNEHR